MEARLGGLQSDPAVHNAHKRVRKRGEVEVERQSGVALPVAHSSRRLPKLIRNNKISKMDRLENTIAFAVATAEHCPSFGLL